MKCVAFIVLICDDCYTTLVANAPPYTNATKAVETALLGSLEWQSKFAGWRMEGPSQWAGDLCSKCLLVENRLISGVEGVITIEEQQLKRREQDERALGIS